MVDAVLEVLTAHDCNRTCQVDLFLDTVTYHDRFLKHKVVFLKDDSNGIGICRDIDILLDIAKTGDQKQSIPVRYV